MDNFQMQRFKLVESLKYKGIHDEKVLEALEKIERHLFIPDNFQNISYYDSPVSIGHDQTISQPFIVAYMTQAADIKPTDTVLEIGTGSGYQAAILASLAEKVYTIELIPELSEKAKILLTNLNFRNIEFICGNGYNGYEEKAPYDVIFVTAAPEEFPKKLLNQLKTGGRMIIPVGQFYSYQILYLVTKKEESQYEIKELLDVRFVPMVDKDKID